MSTPTYIIAWSRLRGVWCLKASYASLRGVGFAYAAMVPVYFHLCSNIFKCRIIGTKASRWSKTWWDWHRWSSNLGILQGNSHHNCHLESIDCCGWLAILQLWPCSIQVCATVSQHSTLLWRADNSCVFSPGMVDIAGHGTTGFCSQWFL